MWGVNFLKVLRHLSRFNSEGPALETHHPQSCHAHVRISECLEVKVLEGREV